MNENNVLKSLDKKVDNYLKDKKNPKNYIDLAEFTRDNLRFSKKIYSKSFYEKALNIIKRIPEHESLLSRVILNYRIGKIEKSEKLLKMLLLNRLDEIIIKKEDYYLPVALIKEIENYPQELKDTSWKVIDSFIKNKESDLYVYFQALKNYDNNEDAKLHFVKVINKDKNNWYAYYMLGDFFSQEKLWRTSIGYYENALSLVQNLNTEYTEIVADIYFGLGWSYSKISNLKEEELAYKECLRIDDKYPYANNNLGYCLFRQKKFNEAIFYLKKAIENKEEEINAMWNIFYVYKAIKDMRNAEKILSEIQVKKGNTKYIKEKFEEIRNKQLSVTNSNHEIFKDEVINSEIGNKNKFPKNHADDKYTFTKEKFLEDMLEERMNKGFQTFGKDLKVFKKNNIYGRQFPIEKGFIDLLAIDVKLNNLFVIELKKGKAGMEVLKQTKDYISYIKEKVADVNQKVYGIICISEATEELKNSIKYNDDFELYEYNITFNKVC